MLELSKIFKYSAKKKSMLLQLKCDLAPGSPGFKPICPTRWTVRAESLCSVLTNYAVIISVLLEIVEEYRGNTEATASARRVYAVMEKISFLFGVMLVEKVFSLTDTLSRALQGKHMFAIEAKKYIAITVGSLKNLRCESKFVEFWSETKAKAEELGVDKPVLPRKRKAPIRFDPVFSTTHVDDNPIGEIDHRFDSDSYKLYGKIEKILLSAAKNDLGSCGDAISDVAAHFNGDLEQSDLIMELALLKNVIAGCEITYGILQGKSVRVSLYLSTLSLLRLLFVIPATSATSERSFSMLRLVKIYLRTTMNQDRLNHLMILHIHKEREINITEAMSEFVLRNIERKTLFGAS